MCDTSVCVAGALGAGVLVRMGEPVGLGSMGPGQEAFTEGLGDPTLHIVR